MIHLSSFPPTGPHTLTAARFIPDVIIGDLDSVRAEVRAFYESRATEVIDLGYDQDTTDLSKVRVFAHPPNFCPPVLNSARSPARTHAYRLLSHEPDSTNKQSLSLIQRQIVHRADASPASTSDTESKWTFDSQPTIVRPALTSPNL